MEPVSRRIEERSDGTGQIRRSLLRTIEVHDSKALEALRQRLEAEETLVGCQGILCHLEHWTDKTDNGWQVKVRSRILPTLRTHLAGLAMEQEELIVLPAQPRKAEQALRLYRDSSRLPDRVVLDLGMSICHGLVIAGKAGIRSCGVTLDTICVTPDGRWLLDGLFVETGESADTVGLLQVLHQLLGGTEKDPEPPFGATTLCRLIAEGRKKPMDPETLLKRLEEVVHGAATAPKGKPADDKPKTASVPKKKETPLKIEGPLPERKVHTWDNPVVDVSLPGKKETPIQTEVPLPERTIHTWNTPVKPASPPQPTIEDTIRKKVHLSSMISAGDGFTAAVRRNGTVLCTRIFPGLTGWTGIKAVAVGGSHLLGLREDGRLRVVGNNFHGQCDVSAWEDIVQISAGMSYSAGLRRDGKLMVAGWVGDKWKHSDRWKDLAAIAAGNQHLVGLRKDGTVIAEGNSQQGQCDVDGWKDIVAVSAGGIHTVGLKADGTVVATGANLFGQCSVQSWKDVIAVEAGADHTVGLLADGTVVTAGNFSFGARVVDNWRNIIAVSAGWSTTVGLTSGGQLMATGKNDYGQCNVGHWRGLI